MYPPTLEPRRPQERPQRRSKPTELAGKKSQIAGIGTGKSHAAQTVHAPPRHRA